RSYRFLHPSHLLVVVKKTKTAPWGMNGGKDGTPGSTTLWPGTDQEQTNGSLHEKGLQPEDVFINRSGGGGGWGNPLRRDPQQVLQDVRNGFVSERSAREDYGVAIHTADWTVDEAATAALRA
ncbi:MAG: hydantoinase B/oxoprolinase family protein, partial [Anaerolineaceae bacterium]|nr:hydantoinase B/oxoprolinase family protein [Anaerolineaceae bacterium]